ncbi:MAG: hypothetical protein CIT01_10580 [Methanobacterium sp. BRmetb2]|jgi:predicted transglutaminase-like protease|nr:MAG: hypothetical protein CIT01_10580 [Methanobacterium sp. BRmetb2]
MLKCVVRKALEELTNHLSIGSNYVKMFNNGEVDRAKYIFKKLYDNDQKIDPDLIVEWANENGKWRERDIKKLKKLVKPISEGKSIRLKNKRFSWPSDIVKKLHEECKKDES